MGEITKTIYKCDCCGLESESRDFQDANNLGHSFIKVNGHEGGRSYDGSWGGVNHRIDLLMCWKCSRELREKINSMQTAGGEHG